MPSLGDAIYCRPFVKEFASSIETKWPALFGDLDLRGSPGQTVSPRYYTKCLNFGSILDRIGRFFPALPSVDFDLPRFERPLLDNWLFPRYAVIRAPTLRDKFYAPARNPAAKYLFEAEKILRRRALATIGVANVGPGERFDGEPPAVVLSRWHGELTVHELLGLLAGATVIVAGPGYTVPAAIAYRVPHIIIYGGAAKWNGLDKLLDPRLDGSRIFAIEPDRFCTSCRDVTHDCDKTISNFEEKFADALDRALSLRRPDIS